MSEAQEVNQDSPDNDLFVEVTDEDRLAMNRRDRRGGDTNDTGTDSSDNCVG